MSDEWDCGRTCTDHACDEVCKRLVAEGAWQPEGTPVMGDEALASIPAENERRARLYDALWHIAYHRGSVKLDYIGGHETIPRVYVGQDDVVFEGDDEQTGPEILAYAHKVQFSP